MKVEDLGYRTDCCKFCGKKIVWAVNETGGGKIPLDPVAPVFRATGPDAPVARQCKQETHGNVDVITLVSHFSTCVAKTRAWKLLDLVVKDERASTDLIDQIRKYMDVPEQG